MVMAQSRRNLFPLRFLPLALGLAAPFASPAHATVHATIYHEQTLHSFCSQPSCADGVLPSAGLIRDSSGNLYGTASSGGANNAGAVFRLKPDGTGYTLLYSFCSLANCADGATPLGGLIMDGSGNLYGTTSDGGTPGCSNSTYMGCGTVYRVKTDGSGFTLLYTFAGYPDASSPAASLIMDNAGNLYGTASSGGALNTGAVFRLNSSGAGYSLLYSFCSQPGCADGAYPLDLAGALIIDGSGNLYGTAANGGGAANAGTAFKLTSGTLTVLYTFCSQSNATTFCTDGATPFAGLILDGSGNLYGTTVSGGATGSGTVFRLSSTAATTGSPVLYSFCSQINCSDGYFPAAGLTIDSSGNLYGTTEFGGTIAGAGSTPSGTLFQLTSGSTTTPWPETVLYTFTGGGDGAQPVAGVARDASTGIFYGTAPYGGVSSASAPSGGGTVFAIGPGSAVVLTPGATCNGVFTGTFKGNITVAAGQSCVFTNPCEIKGNVTVNGGTFQMLGLGCILDGNLIENAGRLVTLGQFSAVGGNVQISGASGFNLGLSGIGGNLQISHVSAGSPETVCAMGVLGNLQLQNNANPIVIGAQGCVGSAVGGNLTASNNSAGLSINSNLVGGNLQANNNTPAAIDVSANKIGGNLQCQGNATVTDMRGTNQEHGNVQGQCVGKHF